MCDNPQNRDFKGIWIPKSIYFDQSLTWTEKILLVEIDSLDHGKGCYASNSYLADFLHVSRDWTKHLLTDLQDRGWISTTENGGQRFIKLTGDHQQRDCRTGQGLTDYRETVVTDECDLETEVPPSAEIQLTSIRKADIKKVYDFWNSISIKPWHVHTKLSYLIMVSVDQALYNYTVEQVCEAIANYAFVLHSPSHYWTHVWTLSSFLMSERSGSIKKWLCFLPENFDETTYRGQKNDNKPKETLVVPMTDNYPDTTETLVKMYKNMTNSQRFEPSPKQRNQFIEAASMLIEYFKPFPMVDKNDRFRLLRRILETKYVEKGETLNVGNFNSKYTWDTLLPQLMRELGYIE